MAVTLKRVLIVTLVLGVHFFCASRSSADLAEIQKSGKLRHLGIPYANFVTGSGDGFDVELMALFAKKINVAYEYHKTDWNSWVEDLTGHKVIPKGDTIEEKGTSQIKGDVAACGITVIPWREKAVWFSSPIFPTQVWLVIRNDPKLKIHPIIPTHDLSKDIDNTKKNLQSISFLCKSNTCLAPELYQLNNSELHYKLFSGSLNELAPAVLSGKADGTLLDVPDTLVALQRWPGKLIVIGPMGPQQNMSVAFPRESTQLHAAFEEFLQEIKANGEYLRLVKKYYPIILDTFPTFFNPPSSNPVKTAPKLNGS